MPVGSEVGVFTVALGAGVEEDFGVADFVLVCMPIVAVLLGFVVAVDDFVGVAVANMPGDKVTVRVAVLFGFVVGLETGSRILRRRSGPEYNRRG